MVFSGVCSKKDLRLIPDPVFLIFKSPGVEGPEETLKGVTCLALSGLGRLYEWQKKNLMLSFEMHTQSRGEWN